MKRTLVILGIILVIILIQIFLSKRKNKWAGLVLPVLILIWSFIYPAANTWNHQPEVSLNFVVQLFIMWFTINISTIMLLGIYLGVREKAKITNLNLEMLKMKYKYTILLGILFGVVMNVLWGTVFSSILGMSGIGVGIALGVAFACCGCLLGYAIDKKNNSKDE